MTAVPAAHPTVAEVVEELLRGQRYRVRFAGVYAALGLALAGAGAAVGLLATSRAQPRWSAWQPHGNRPVAAIAAHVSREYAVARAQGEAMPTVTLAGTRLAVKAIAVVGRTVQTNAADGTVSYSLCGHAFGCGIVTRADARAVVHESLELALDTLEYTPAENVVVFPPAPVGGPQTGAFFFTRGRLAAALRTPLRTTLAHVAAARPLLLPAYHDFTVTRLQAGGAMLVLRPPGSVAGV